MIFVAVRIPLLPIQNKLYYRMAQIVNLNGVFYHKKHLSLCAAPKGSIFMDQSKSPAHLHQGHRSRLRERFAISGLESFADHEVLELILSYARPRIDTNHLAHRLLNTFGSLPAVLHAEKEELCKVSGIGEISASLLLLFAPVARRLFSQQNEETFLSTSTQAARYISSLLLGRKTECLYLICLDASYRVLHKCVVMEGSIDSVPVSAREIAAIALRHNASRLILAHNHPGGNVLPSRQDIAVTQELVQTLSRLEIQLSDHIIVCGQKYYSFADKSSHINTLFTHSDSSAADSSSGVAYAAPADPSEA